MRYKRMNLLKSEICTVNPFRYSRMMRHSRSAIGWNVEDSSVGIATDLGKYNDYIVENLQSLDALLLEANHDIRMLQVGRYPYYLKQTYSR